MLSYIKQKIKDRFDMKTYNVGILQDQAYRALKKQTNLILADYNITSFDWAILGLLFESSAGINAIDLAEEIGVSQAFISKVLKRLKSIKYIEIKKGEDARYKKIYLSELGMSKVLEIEPMLKKGMRPLIKGVSVTDLYSYINVLKKIAENS